MCVAHRRIKRGKAGREICGDNYDSLNKNARLGGGRLLFFGSTAYLKRLEL
jgi:hypothetical protein